MPLLSDENCKNKLSKMTEVGYNDQQESTICGERGPAFKMTNNQGLYGWLTGLNTCQTQKFQGLKP